MVVELHAVGGGGGSSFQCNSCGAVGGGYLSKMTHTSSCTNPSKIVQGTYKCSGCGTIGSAAGTHTKISSYSINCGKTAGSKSYTRTITTYRCNTCGASHVYKPSANSGTCAYCKSSHSASASGSTSGNHNAVSRYLVCAYK